MKGEVSAGSRYAPDTVDVQPLLGPLLWERAGVLVRETANVSASVLYIGRDSVQSRRVAEGLGGLIPLLQARDCHEALPLISREDVFACLVDGGPEPRVADDVLARLAEHFPKVSRVLLCSESQEDIAVEAMSQGTIHCYLRKPVDPRLAASTLRELDERRRMRLRIRELERRLQATERLYSLGVIAAGITHEIRNPLGALQSNLDLSQNILSSLAKRQNRDDQLGRDLRLAVEALEDCSSAASAIFEITRSVELTTRSSEDEEVQLEEVVQLAIRSLRSELRGQGQVRVEAPEDLPPVRGSRTRLGQVVLNLLLNALEAVRGAKKEPRDVAIRLRAEDDALVMEVEDTGPGIEAASLGRIFDPFFTTKTRGGTGLGLAISRRIVEDLGGRIEVRSHVGAGACFSVFLPRAS